MTANALHLRPRAIMSLATVVGGVQQDNTDVLPESVVVKRDSHSRANTCTVTLDGSFFPFDTRGFDSITAYVFMGNAEVNQDGTEQSIAEERNLRFVGDGDDMRERGGDANPQVTFTFRDMSAPLRDKKLPPDAVPYYNDTLRQAFQRIIDHCPRAKGRIRLRETDALDLELARLTHKTHAHHPIGFPKSDPSCWEAMEYLAGLANRVVQVDLLDVVVRFPEESFGVAGVKRDSDRPAAVFVFGGDAEGEVKLSDGTTAKLETNVVKYDRGKKFSRHTKGIKVFGHDPTGRQQISGTYPSDGKLPPKTLPKSSTIRGQVQLASKQAAATRKAAKPASEHGAGHGKKTAAPHSPPAHVENDPDRDIFYSRDIHTVEGLNEYAERIWHERASQEFDGTLETPLFIEPYLSLNNGDRVIFKVYPLVEHEIQSRRPDLAVEFLQKTLLMGRKTAEVLVLVALRRKIDLVYLKTASLRWYKDQAPAIEVEYQNLLAVLP